MTRTPRSRQSGEEIEAPTHTKFLGTTIGKPAGGEVLKSEADTAEYRHLLMHRDRPDRVPASTSPSSAWDSIGRQTSTAHGPHCDGKRAIVHHDASAASSASAAISHFAGLVGAESRDVHSGSQMPAKQERLLSPGRRHDDVSAVERFIENGGQSDIATPLPRPTTRRPPAPHVIKTLERPSKPNSTEGRESLAVAHPRR